MIINNLYARLSNIVPEADCDTFGDEYENIVWRDSRPLPSEQEILAVDENSTVPNHPKVVRDEALQEMQLDLGGGRVIQTRPQDEQNIRSKISAIKAGFPDLFIMKDNKAYPVTISELESAIAHGIEEQERIYSDYIKTL